MKSFNIIFVAIFSMFCFLVTSLTPMAATNSCMECHKGIEPISDVPAMRELDCQFCHRGNPRANDKEKAHTGLWANPSDYHVASQTCGLCHDEILKKSKKSLHATSAGIISATRYLFAAQKTRNAIYATYAVTDKDGKIPEEKGALPSLKQIPTYNPNLPESTVNSPADDYLREECLRCHLYSYGMERPGDYRSSGCAACHMVYGDDGKYLGRDRAIVDEKTTSNHKARPQYHKITTVIPPFQCLHCHNRGGRTGVSYIGTMESDGYGSPWSEKPGIKGGKKLHGKYYNHLTPDIHYQKGLYCIDCHTKQDLHGDGNIYSKKDQAVEIECQDCHGTATSKSRLTSSWGNPLNNLVCRGTEIILISKNGKEHKVPQVMDIIAGGSQHARDAMGIPAHMARMECYACHARWAPQCYGCHAQQDTTTPSLDWINTKTPMDQSQTGRAENRRPSAFKWRETRSYLRWESPALGINQEGLVSPFIPGCQVIFTQIAPDGTCKVHNKVYKTADGLWAIATNPIQPHTISNKARSCEDCHANPKALGLGTGIYNLKANGVNLPFELEKIVTQQGQQLQATSHYGARPFNKEELERITRINTCAACHGFDAKILLKGLQLEKKILNDKIHKRLLQKLLKGSQPQNNP